MKINKFFFVGAIGIFLILTSVILLVTKNVSGFDIFSSVKNDCVPYNVFVEKGNKDYSVSILWSTKAKCFGFVQYGMDQSNLESIGVDMISNSKSKSHSVTIEKISSSEKYFFLINSDSQTYGNNGIPLEFTLSAL
ncbi:MAG: hypothetical protein AB9915_01335 [Candidatus Dojkabacteria bacterium]